MSESNGAVRLLITVFAPVGLLLLFMFCFLVIYLMLSLLCVGLIALVLGLLWLAGIFGGIVSDLAPPALACFGAFCLFGTGALACSLFWLLPGSVGLFHRFKRFRAREAAR